MVVLKEAVNSKYFTEKLIVKPPKPINLKYPEEVMGQQNGPQSFISYFHLKQDDLNARVKVLSQ